MVSHPSSLLIRDFAPQDRDAFRELNEAWIQEYFCLEDEDRRVLGDPETNILQRGGRIYIADVDGTPVGCCALLFHELGVFELGKMAVAPAMRGGGIGRRILAHTLEQARTLGAKKIQLGSHSRLPDAIHLYEAFGFRHLPPEKFPASPYTRAEIFMELDLQHTLPAGYFKNTMSTPPIDQILQTGLAFWPSKILLSAVELQLFTELAKGPLDHDSLSGSLALHPRASLDFLDTLVALGFLERNDGKYANTPSTDFFLDKAKPSYVGGILEMANLRLYPFWNNLTAALRNGLPQNEAALGGPDFFGTLYSDPDRLKGFLCAMTGISRGANMRIASQFPWANYKSAVDVGTAQGDLIVQVTLANPHLAGTGFDLEPVGAVFNDYVAANGLSSRVKFAPGSFFTDSLPQADVVMMGHILHDWNLEEKRMLISKAYDAIPDGGALIVYDSIIDDDRSKNAFGLMMSLNMLIETPGGFDYTGADCMGWMKDAGFRETRTEHLVGPDSMVIGIR